MGKRKKSGRKPPPKKKLSSLPTVFSCLFCNHERSVTVKIDKKAGVGSLSCQVCGQTFQSPVNYLSAPVDVYYDWVDACDAVAKESGQDSRSQAPLVSPRINRKDSEAAARADKYDEQDGFVVADEADAGDGDFPDDA